jgi:hypothetical protein
MYFFTRIDQGDISYIYSHSLETMYVFPQTLSAPSKIALSEFFRRINEARKIALQENISFSVKQYCSKDERVAA